MRFFSLLLGLAFSFGHARADNLFGYGQLGEAPANALTWEKVADAVTDARHPLASVEDLLRWIAETHPEFLENFTLMRESRSSQGASARSPRAIVFQRDGRLMLTFNGDPKQPGYDRVELIQYREPNPGSPVGTSFEFREIRFRTGHATISPPNPDRCRQCHQAVLRPIWPPYEVWPGSYGKYDDALPDYDNDKYAFTGQPAGQIKEQKEALRDYRAYFPHWLKHPRYRFLRFAADSPVTPYSPRTRGEDRFRPNLHLTHLVGLLHARQLAGELAADRSCFAAHRSELLSALLDCEHSYPRRAPEVLERMGMEKEQWNPDENPSVWDYFVGVSYIDGLVADQLYPLARSAESQLPEFSVARDYLVPSVYRANNYSPDEEGQLEYPPPSPIEKICAVLSARPADTSSCASKVPAGGGPALRMCLTCHDGGVSGVPVLPLRDRTALDTVMREKIRDRITRTGQGAMPPTRRLTSAERRALLEYLAPPSR